MTTPSSRSASVAPADTAPDPPGATAEWLETDGRGGFACGTVTMCPARRYHGLLIAPRPGTATRHLFLAGFDEHVATATGAVALARRAHAGDPGEPGGPGPDVPATFARIPWPCTRYRLDGGAIQREILMPKGRHAVLVRYSVPAGAAPLTLTLRPRLPMRAADALTFRNDVLCPDVEDLGDRIRCRPYAALPALTLRHESVATVEFRTDPDWDCGVEYAIDLDRGNDGHEDLFSPGCLTVHLAPGQDLLVGATLDPELDAAGLDPARLDAAGPDAAGPDAAGLDAAGLDESRFDLRAVWNRETRRRGAAGEPALDDLAGRCAQAADDFLYVHPVRRAGRWEPRHGILAGFPWFGEWGRDTFIALPGLTLARGLPDLCAEILRGVIPFVADGLVPNIFGTGPDDSHYGSVDAALWFARAVLLYDRATGDARTVQAELYPVLVAIAGSYAGGTADRIRALGIGTDAAGMVFAGDATQNPTWMDAKPASGAVTPRHGCPVEIAALWYSLLCHLAELAAKKADHPARARFAAQVTSAGAAFRERFWLDQDGYLADVWRPDAGDASLRPNMVLAAALEFSPLDPAQRQRIVARARAELLTPKGLRTLSPHHPDYAPRYAGGPEERDRAYHQGTVWPWLLGSYCEAALRADPSCRGDLRALLDGLLPELARCGLDHVSEVFDGDAPHRPGGTFAQAWNTAEILRACALIDGTLPLGARAPGAALPR